jgi:hypothetical protein
MSRKYSMLFWCGLFVALFAGYLLITDVFSIVAIFSLPASFLSSYSASSILSLIILRTAIFTALYALLLAVGIYVLSKGITHKLPPPPLQPVEQPTSETAV